MRYEILWTSIYDFSRRVPRLIKKCRTSNDFLIGSNKPYISFQQRGGYYLQYTGNVVQFFAVDNLPGDIGEKFFSELLELKMYCFIGECGMFRLKNIFLNYQEEAGSCLIRLQAILTARGLTWNTLWDYDLIHITQSTAARYKRVSRSYRM